MIERTPVLDHEHDLSQPAASSDRLNFWRDLRRESPVAFSPAMNMWIVSTHDAVMEVVRDTTRFGKQPRRPPVVKLIPEAARLYEEYQREYVPTFENNPPVHSAYRQKVLPTLSAPRMEARRPIIVEMANGLVDEFEGKGEADVIDAYCFPLPALHSFEMVGVPAADLQLVRRISLASIELQNGMPAPEEQVALAKDSLAYWRYLVALVEDHRKSKANGMVNDLINAATGDDNIQLSSFEIASILKNVVVGAHKTTTNLIGNTLHSLLSSQSLWAQVVSDPGLARGAVDESLRLHPPAPGHFYVALQDTELEGVAISKGELVYPAYASANHDEAHFSNPGDFELDRPNDRKSLTFGAGPHLCAGKALGRVTGSAAVEVFVRRLPKSRLVDPTPHWIPNVTTQGLSRLDIRWD